jgi:type I restriction enzyme M protein
LDQKARGATIRRLSRQALEELPVPLPPLQIQQRVATEHRDHGVDALVFLAQLLTQGEQDPIAAWVDKASAGLPLDMDSVDDPLDFVPLDHLAGDVHEIRNQVVHGSHGESILAPWLLAFSKAMSGLQGVSSIPQGPGLLSVLQESARDLVGSVSLIKGYLPNEAVARDLTTRLAAGINRACSALLGRVELIVDTDTTVFPVGEMVQLELEVQNQGPLPLRNLHLTTNPNWGGGGTPYLAEKSKTTVSLSGVALQKPGSFTLAVTWGADTIDGRPVGGVREIALDFTIKASYIDHIKTDIGASPYVCGDPVRPDRNDVFFGREDLLEQIRRQITHSGNVVLLEGNRRSGKSSVLLHLVGTDLIPGWLGIYCSLQDMEGSREGVGVPTVDVFRGMARSIAKGLQAMGDKTPLPDGTELPPDRKLGIVKACREGISETSPFSDFRDYLEVALDILAKRNLGLLLMLDEFDKLQEGIESGVTSPQVPENIRFLLQTFPRFSAILTGSRRLKRLREAYWSALYGLGTRFGVSSLPAEHARRLVTEPVKGRLNYSREAVERAIFLTSGQPFLLQCLCNRVFDMAAQLKRRSVTLDLVDQAGNAMVQDNEHFASLWDYAGSDRKRFLLALCHKESDNPDPLRLGVIQERLLDHGIEISEETLIADLEYLRELELIELVGEASGGHYVLAIPLMGTWIEKHQDFTAIKRKAKMETEDQHE